MAKVYSLSEYKENKSPHLLLDLTKQYNDGTNHHAVCPVEMFKNWASGTGLKELNAEEIDSFGHMARYIVRDWLIRVLDSEGKLHEHPDLIED